MKLVEILAKEMGVWPLDAAWVGQAVDGDIHVNNIDDEFIRHTGVLLTRADDWNSAEINQAQWQAERDRQKGGEWKRHRGGDKPKSVSDGEMVEVRLRCGDTQTAYADKFLWNHSDCDESVHITKYRVISQPQAEEVEVKDTTIGTLSLKAEVDTSDATQAIDDLAAKRDQIETPFKWRDEVTELNAYIEKYTREREVLINRLALEGFSLIPPVVTAETDVLPFEEWQVGDVVEVTNVDEFCNEEIKVGDQLPIIMVDKSDDTVSVGIGTWSHTGSYKFIRRP